MNTSSSIFPFALKGQSNGSGLQPEDELFCSVPWALPTATMVHPVGVETRNPQPSAFARAVGGASNDWKFAQGPFPMIGTCRRGNTPKGLTAASPGLRVFEPPWDKKQVNTHLISYNYPERVEARGSNPVGVVPDLFSLSQGRPTTANPGLKACHPVGVEIGDAQPSAANVLEVRGNGNAKAAQAD